MKAIVLASILVLALAPLPTVAAQSIIDCTGPVCDTFCNVYNWITANPWWDWIASNPILSVWKYCPIL